MHLVHRPLLQSASIKKVKSILKSKVLSLFPPRPEKEKGTSEVPPQIYGFPCTCVCTNHGVHGCTPQLVFTTVLSLKFHARFHKSSEMHLEKEVN
jgi:hypothetical protein